MAPEHAQVQGVRHGLPARGALRLRAMLRAARGRLRPLAASTPRRRSARSRPGPAGSGATPTSCPFDEPPARPAAARPDAAGARRPARRAARPRRGLDQERRRQPDPLVQGPGRRGGAGEGARARLRDRRLRLDRQPRQRGRRARRGGRPRLLRLRARRPRGAEAARDRRLRHRTWSASSGNYDDVNRLCTELARDAALGVRQRQPAPVLRGGLEDDRLRDWSSSSAGRCPTGSSARSPRARCSRRSAAASSEWLDLGLVEGELPAFNGAQADGCSPVAEALRRGPGRLPARSARTRSPRASRSATRPTAPTRSTSRAQTGGSIESVTDDEIRAGIRLLAETTGHLHRDRRRVTTAMLAKLAEAGAIGPTTERVVASSPARA